MRYLVRSFRLSLMFAATAVLFPLSLSCGGSDGGDDDMVASEGDSDDGSAGSGGRQNSNQEGGSPGVSDDGNGNGGEDMSEDGVGGKTMSEGDMGGSAGDTPSGSGGNSGGLQPTSDGGKGMPVGIPAPDFGYDPIAGDATLYVDNTHPNCDNTQGTADAPWCDVFAGENTLSLSAGTIVEVRGGPYAIDRDKTIVVDGSAAQPVVVRGIERPIISAGDEGPAELLIDGQFGVVAGFDFFDNVQLTIAGSDLALRDSEVHQPGGMFRGNGFNPVVQITGTRVVVVGNRIYDNRRANDTDSHGIQVGRGASWVWVLDNVAFNNNGDALQSCHQCRDEYPHHVFIGRNTFHDDRENAVDFKDVRDVVVAENTFYNYHSAGTSSGDAIVIGSDDGFNEQDDWGPFRIWIINNHIRDSFTGIRIEGTERSWLVGNVIEDVEHGILFDIKPSLGAVVANNTLARVTNGIDNNGTCGLDNVQILNNLIVDASERHLDLATCLVENGRIAANLFANDSPSLRVGTNLENVTALNELPIASGNREGDPSQAVDAGTSMEAIFIEFEYQFPGASIRLDRDGDPRPRAGAIDIGADEH